MKKYVEIEYVHAREVLDSRGNPTVEVEVHTEEGDVGRAIVPSGASTGKYEAKEIRDGDKNRYNGKGVLNAVSNVNSVIAQELEGLNVLNQTEIDETLLDLDGTENKAKLGANAILGVSIASAKAAACNLQIPLFQHLGGISGRNIPSPMVNILNGGRHSDNNVNIQEFMIVPTGIDYFSERLRMCTEVYWKLKSILKENHYATSVGDEGGFAPNLEKDEEALALIMQAIEECGYQDHFGLALDVAASEMYEDGEYHFWKTGNTKTTEEMINYYEELIEKYPIISIEDGLGEEDWDGWQDMTRRLGDKVQLVGDDLFTTNVNRLIKGIDCKAANSILIKPNQIGTITETIDAIRIGKSHGYSAIISHRSGDTEDPFIADLAVGLNAKYIKAGAPTRSERTAKYNRLLRIEEMMGY
ncbi:MAG: phosphopyruvate hydratase [Clostridia bacterium]|nr:phosphopyruvate hydratase [Clostridia bacterium]